MTREQAEHIRDILMQAAELLPDDAAMEIPEFFDKWEPDIDYVAGDRRQYEGLLYKCLQAHHSQTDWTPDVAVSLWTRSTTEEWPEWVQPTGAHDAYNAGDKVVHNEIKYISKIDANVWEPGSVGTESLWETLS